MNIKEEASPLRADVSTGGAAVTSLMLGALFHTGIGRGFPFFKGGG